MKCLSFLFLAVFLFSCQSKQEKIRPYESPVTESVYASGTIKSKNQYQVFSAVSGVIKDILVKEGDTVVKDQIIVVLDHKAQKLNTENAALNAQFSSLNANKEKLNEAQLQKDLLKNKLQNDSLLYERQKDLWNQRVGSKVELEQRQLAFQNAKVNYFAAKVKYDDLKKQLELNAAITERILALSDKTESDYSVKSELNGIMYALFKKKGEIVGPQTPIGIIGEANHFILEMQIDEYDILKIAKGQQVFVTLDSYKNKVFKAQVTKINPLMNDRNKTFLVEAEFTEPPQVLYPNISFEASILLKTKSKALLIPRKCVLNDSLVIKTNGDTVKIETGLKDYQNIEVISGISKTDELRIPNK